MDGLKKVIPLILLLLFVAIVAFVGYAVWTVVLDVKKNTRAEMERKHVSFSRDGMKVSMKEINDESYKDRTQSVLVNMWNHTSFPAYKSRLWDMTGSSGSSTENGAEKRKPYVSLVGFFLEFARGI
ncbi:uncharacterized protein N7484_006291 [Penicillium longicatenatum]|uniref:uncharacterized protein n=1 Tax=Penicillium longicatenatum TaxID=1561947 RepID=UPI002547EF2D|nr:uncharacterized protein N7484_006291 [Penicillium longicatenatum]KAJ5643784.1 hypothetical protein N7484_006291 [Penicillium longicatenatum]